MLSQLHSLSVLTGLSVTSLEYCVCRLILVGKFLLLRLAMRSLFGSELTVRILYVPASDSVYCFVQPNHGRLRNGLAIRE
jgi:hypothetical protein